MKLFKQKSGNTVVTMPIMLIISIFIIINIGVHMIELTKPFLIYEKLNTIALKYMFIIEKFGYLTEIEKNNMLNEMSNKGIDISRVSLKFPDRLEEYGELIEFSITYLEYINLPSFINGKLDINKKEIKIEVNKNSYSKR